MFQSKPELLNHSFTIPAFQGHRCARDHLLTHMVNLELYINLTCMVLDFRCKVGEENPHRHGDNMQTLHKKA